MVGQAVSHYRILRRLGAGGMGVVYLAADTVLGRQVAIKFPTEGSGGVGESARLLSEARKASRLQHPKIAQIHEFGETAEGLEKSIEHGHSLLIIRLCQSFDRRA